MVYSHFRNLLLQKIEQNIFLKIYNCFSKTLFGKYCKLRTDSNTSSSFFLIWNYLIQKSAYISVPKNPSSLQKYLFYHLFYLLLSSFFYYTFFFRWTLFQYQIQLFQYFVKYLSENLRGLKIKIFQKTHVYYMTTIETIWSYFWVKPIFQNVLKRLVFQKSCASILLVSTHVLTWSL